MFDELFDLLVLPCLLAGTFVLIFGCIAFAELWKGKSDDENRKGKK